MRHSRPPQGNSSLAVPLPEALKSPDAERVRRRNVLYGPWVPLGFVLPALVYFAAMFGYPLYYSISMSVRHFTVASFLTGVAPFVGLRNYVDLFTDRLFLAALGKTAIFTAFSIGGQMAVGMLLALFFRRAFPFSSAMRALLLAPWLLPIVVSASVWRWMFAQDTGIINYVLLSAGVVSEPLPWLIEPAYALCAVILTNIWIGIPFSMAVFHSGLQALPKEIFEAAEIDGANAWQRFRFVTLPLLKPLTAIVFILSVTYTVKVFDLIFVMTGGGPAYGTETLAIRSYQLSFRDLDFGHGAAVGNVLILISLCFAFFYIRSFKRSLVVEEG